jgi:hypothetical protein
MPYLDDERWLQLVHTRAEQPHLALERLRTRRRRALLTDGKLFIVAADHTARGMLGVPGEPFAMADRRRTLEALLVALANPGCDGVLASADIMEDLALLGALDGKLAFGTMNRGGIMGAAWELDDRMTAYSAAALAANGVDGGKVLLRLADDDAGTAPTLEACARAVTELADVGLMAMVEPLPYTRDASGRAVWDHDPVALLRAVAVSSGLGGTSAYTWLKVPASADIARVASATTLPLLLLGGPIGPDPAATSAAWEQGLAEPSVRGLVAGRALLYPPDGDVAGAIDAAGALVQRAAEARR